jgi:hypothetical protein
MTEAEWLACADPVAMLDSMDRKISDRKTRLFACACCRHFSNLAVNEQFVQAIETAEQFADGLTSKAAMKRARQSVRAIRHSLPDKSDLQWWAALWLAEVTNSENAYGQVAHEIKRFIAEGMLSVEYAPLGADLIRCIIGNPFRPVRMEPSWTTPDVVALVRTLYASRNIEQLPMLADALENAGCCNRDILSHCRQPGLHVRGCWAVDLVLGRK